LEEVAAETTMTLDTMEYYQGVTEGPALYASFRRAAAELSATAFPQVEPLEDGGIFALRLDEDLSSKLQPLEEVRDEVILGWQQTKTRERLREEAETLVAQLDLGADLDSGGAEVVTVEARTREAILPDTPINMVFEVFNIEEPGNTTILEDAEEVFLIVLDAINDPDAEDERLQAIRAQLSDRANVSLADDLVLLFGTAIAQQTDITYNTRAIEAVHAELP
ncbi:MAG: peptidylprolyl isomerase, partial [Pseudomonadota bacterium]